MGAGRKAVPTKLKLLKGTQPCRINKSEPKPTDGRPDPPARLDAESKLEWHRLCDQLAAMGVLNISHGFALAIYCGAYSRLLIANEALKEHGALLITGDSTGDDGAEGRIVIKSNPAAAIAAQCERIMLAVLTEFGLTASSASKVSATHEDKDEFADFIKKRG